MKELEGIIDMMEEKREELLSRMEKGDKLIQETNSKYQRVRYEMRYERLQKAYHRLVLALALLRLDE